MGFVAVGRAILRNRMKTVGYPEQMLAWEASRNPIFPPPGCARSISCKLVMRIFMPEIQRRKSVTVKVGSGHTNTVRVGWEAPVVVQSMTNTDTADILGTIDQIQALALAGSEIVRVT